MTTKTVTLYCTEIISYEEKIENLEFLTTSDDFCKTHLMTVITDFLLYQRSGLTSRLGCRHHVLADIVSTDTHFQKHFSLFIGLIGLSLIHI